VTRGWLVVVAAVGACSDPVEPAPDAPPPVQPSKLPAKLSRTGLYAELSTKTLADETI
jgi:hypothetical protein